MSKRISLDDSSYERIYERAMERLQLQAPWWTHRQLSDPGITLLEMWAILADMQSYYMDQMQEAHYRKYLKLLGIAADEGKCAAVWVFFDGVEEACIVPQGTKLLADQMVFEIEEEVELIPNRISGFYPKPGRNMVSVMNISRKSSFTLQEHKERILFSFSLQKAVEAGKLLRFFVLLDETKNRNPAGEDFYMAQLVWEYWTGAGWKEVQVLRDDTRGLLYSGVICLISEHAMISDADGGGRLRCRIRSGEYDAEPVLYKIYLNVGKAVQRNTLCCEETAEFSEKCRRVAVKSYLARTGRLQVLERQQGDVWKDVTAECVVDPPVTAKRRQRYLYFSGGCPVKIICTADDAAEEYLPCPVTGVPSQQIALPWENVMRDTVELMLGQGDGGGLYRMYRREEPEEERWDNAWHWQEGKNVIELGDGRHGDIPEPSGDGLRLTSLVLWEGEKGNISIGRITQWEKPELFPGISCTNLLAGRGGSGRKKPSEQFAEAAQVILRENRMVTEEDIRTLAMETPGLLLQDAAAEWRDGTAVVTVFPTKHLTGGYCAEQYKRRVAEYLEPFRIAGSRIKVVVAGAEEAKKAAAE